MPGHQNLVLILVDYPGLSASEEVQKEKSIKLTSNTLSLFWTYHHKTRTNSKGQNQLVNLHLKIIVTNFNPI